MASKELQVLEDYIVQNKLKITKQRRAVLNAFLECEKHVSAEELYNQVTLTDPKVGLATVYRTLALLTQSGLASDLDFGDGQKRYESSFKSAHHDHMVCTECGKIIEFNHPLIEKYQEEIAIQNGFKIISESGIAAGIRRIEAMTGIDAYQLDKKNEESLNLIANLTKSNSSQTAEKVKQLISHQKHLEKQIATFQKQLASDQGDALTSKAIDVNGIKVLATEVSGVAAKDLKDLADKLKDKLGSAVVILAAVSDKKVSLVVAVTKDLIGQYQAGNILNHVATQIGGKGGGRSDMAQGGGTEPDKLPKALNSVKDLF